MHETIDNLEKIKQNISLQLNSIVDYIEQVQEVMRDAVLEQAEAAQFNPFMDGLTVFVLAVFVGYYVVWRVTPALHSPLMAVTNAISSVIIVGGIIALGQATTGLAQVMGFIVIFLASINIFGGFFVTQRMLEMFTKKR